VSVDVGTYYVHGDVFAVYLFIFLCVVFIIRVFFRESHFIQIFHICIPELKDTMSVSDEIELVPCARTFFALCKGMDKALLSSYHSSNGNSRHKQLLVLVAKENKFTDENNRKFDLL